jgi:F-type H+-transporting ATPase subunit delta
MRSRALAKRYARAVLALAKEDGDPAAIATALERAAVALEDPTVAPVVASPALDTETRLSLVRRLIESLGLPRLVGNCLCLLAERQRLDLVGDLWRTYVDLLDEALGRRRVAVRSAAALTDEQLRRVLDGVRRLVGAGEIVPLVEVDPELIGGVVVEVGGVVYDGSIRTQVRGLARRMVAAGP